MTGSRYANQVSPRDTTGRKARELLLTKQARDNAADIDVGAIREAGRRAGWQAGFEAGFDAGWAGLAETLTDAGLDVDSVLALNDDEHQGDEPAGDE